MNWLDVVLIVLLVVPTFIGYKMGLIKMVLPLAGVFFGVVLASALHGFVADLLENTIENEAWAHIAGFLIVFFVVFILVYLLAALIRKILQVMLLGSIDSILGAALVFVTIWLLSSLIVAMVAKYGALGADYIPGGIIRSESVENVIDGSALATFQIDIFPVIIGLLPDEFEVVRKYF